MGNIEFDRQSESKPLLSFCIFRFLFQSIFPARFDIFPFQDPMILLAADALHCRFGAGSGGQRRQWSFGRSCLQL